MFYNRIYIRGISRPTIHNNIEVSLNRQCHFGRAAVNENTHGMSKKYKICTTSLDFKIAKNETFLMWHQYVIINFCNIYSWLLSVNEWLRVGDNRCTSQQMSPCPSTSNTTDKFSSIHWLTAQQAWKPSKKNTLGTILYRYFNTDKQPVCYTRMARGGQKTQIVNKQLTKVS